MHAIDRYEFFPELLNSRLLEAALERAACLATERGHKYCDDYHFMLAAVDMQEPVARSLDMTFGTLSSEIDRIVRRERRRTKDGDLSIGVVLKSSLVSAARVSLHFERQMVDPFWLVLLDIVIHPSSLVSAVLRASGKRITDVTRTICSEGVPLIVRSRICDLYLMRLKYGDPIFIVTHGKNGVRA